MPTPDGAPEEVEKFREEIISGVYDLVPPEQYGRRALPLRYDIIFGEEMQVLFTESIWCEKPQLFTIEIELVGTNITLSNKNGYLQVNCRENILGFHLKNILPEDVAGKEFKVVIEGVQDKARNEIENSITFTKRFANLDLDGASTTFKFTMTNTTCTEEGANAQSDEVRDEIASHIGLESVERVQIHSLDCLENSKLIVDAEILPEEQETTHRKLRNLISQKSRKNTYGLVVDLKNHVESMPNRDRGSRALKESSDIRSYSVSAIGIRPSEKDKLKFSSSQDELLEENTMRSYNPEEQLVSNIEIDSNGNPSKSWRDDKEELVSKLAHLEARLLQEKTNEENKLELKLAQMQDRLLKEKESEFEALKQARSNEIENMVVLQGSIILVVGSLIAIAIYSQRKKD